MTTVTMTAEALKAACNIIERSSVYEKAASSQTISAFHCVTMTVDSTKSFLRFVARNGGECLLLDMTVVQAAVQNHMLPNVQFQRLCAIVKTLSDSQYVVLSEDINGDLNVSQGGKKPYVLKTNIGTALAPPTATWADTLSIDREMLNKKLKASLKVIKNDTAAQIYNCMFLRQEQGELWTVALRHNGACAYCSNEPNPVSTMQNTTEMAIQASKLARILPSFDFFNQIDISTDGKNLYRITGQVVNSLHNTAKFGNGSISNIEYYQLGFSFPRQKIESMFTLPSLIEAAKINNDDILKTIARANAITEQDKHFLDFNIYGDEANFTFDSGYGTIDDTYQVPPLPPNTFIFGRINTSIVGPMLQKDQSSYWFNTVAPVQHALLITDVNRVEKFLIMKLASGVFQMPPQQPTAAASAQATATPTAAAAEPEELPTEAYDPDEGYEEDDMIDGEDDDN